jgi:hypothetical protein
MLSNIDHSSAFLSVKIRTSPIYFRSFSWRRDGNAPEYLTTATLRSRPVPQVRNRPTAQAAGSHGGGTGRVVGSEGNEAEVDGGHFGGYVKRANQKE